MRAREPRQKRTKATKINVNVLACREEKTEELAEMIDCLLLIKAWNETQCITNDFYDISCKFHNILLYLFCKILKTFSYVTPQAQCRRRWFDKFVNCVPYESALLCIYFRWWPLLIKMIYSEHRVQMTLV